MLWASESAWKTKTHRHQINFEILPIVYLSFISLFYIMIRHNSKDLGNSQTATIFWDMFSFKKIQSRVKVDQRTVDMSLGNFF